MCIMDRNKFQLHGNIGFIYNSMDFNADAAQILFILYQIKPSKY